MAYRLDSTGKLNTLAASPTEEAVEMTLSADQYQRFCAYLEKHSGIVLGESKEYLILSRLRTIFESFKLTSFAELIQSLEKDESRELKKRVIDAMTTNETLWFRDSHPFEILNQTILPKLNENRSERPLRIWSAASSTGQEAYSISITLTEFLKRNPGSFSSGYEILATDLCGRAIMQAKAARYDNYEIVRGLSEDHQQRYFQRVGDMTVVNPAIRDHVRFQEMNLLQSYTLLGQFDVVFLRNVLIYFSNDLKTDILNRMSRVLKPGGYLFLGGSEPIANYSDQYDMIRCPQGVVYQLKQNES